MVKRKEVKIDEEQIRRVMAGDIPASVLENRYGSNAADSQKEDEKKPETENWSGIPAKSDKVEVPGSGVSGGEEEAPSPVLREKTHMKPAHFSTFAASSIMPAMKLFEKRAQRGSFHIVNPFPSSETNMYQSFGLSSSLAIHSLFPACRLSSLLNILLRYMLSSRHTVMIRLPL